MMKRHSTWIFSVVTFFALTVFAVFSTPTLAFANQTSTESGSTSGSDNAATDYQIFMPITAGIQSAESSSESPAESAGSTDTGNADVVNDIVQLAWFYKPPTAEELKALPKHFETFILTKNDEDERDELKAQGVEAPFLQYISFDVIIDPGSCTAQPWRNQAADRPGDFCYISDNHPDWFMLDADGNRMYRDLGSGMRSALMDPGHPGWRAFWLERARESQEMLGWEGVFLDNVEASLAKRERRNQMPAAYQDDASYQAAVTGFLAYIYAEYFQPEGRPLYGNIIAQRNSDTWFDYMQYLDGGMEEGWAVDWSDGYLSAKNWQKHLEKVEKTQQIGKHSILVAQGYQHDETRQAFAYASYLLVSNGNSSFRYTNDDNYREQWLYSNYDLELGAPLGTRYQDGDAWVRDFTNGSVQVDPLTQTATITMN